ncbi:hypothetical protein [Blastopirellula marina]|uniref:Uncharacterized protein n=1 Tax=Blastopirellula marina TaxID=124 RepID=A0A2S8G1B5_9BACT|nr:hypothetical protein [Blastopirellula marina]PQO38233.1 hypothetical protein C5Y98_09190 [Blastopirellula marina]PTL44889.1 hypothetical protein C5Y97_09195 [Blastopirellula marina]
MFVLLAAFGIVLGVTLLSVLFAVFLRWAVQRNQSDSESNLGVWEGINAASDLVDLADLVESCGSDCLD